MKIVEHLSALALRPLLDGSKPASGADAPAGDTLYQLFTSQGDRVRRLLSQAIQQGWRVLEVALAGPAVWNLSRTRLSADEQAIGQKVDQFLQIQPLGSLPVPSADFRRNCLRELRSGRKSGLLSGELDPSTGWVDRLGQSPRGADADWQLVAEIADEMRSAFPTLSEFLTLRPADGPSPLTRAVRLCFRRIVQTDAELARFPGLAELPALTPNEKSSLDAISDVLTQHGDRLDSLLVAAGSELPATGAIESETAGEADPVPQLGRAVARHLQHHRLGTTEVRPAEWASLNEGDRQRIRELANRIHALPAEQLRRLPGLLHGLALLEAAAGHLDHAQNDLQEGLAAASDPQMQAQISFTAYRVALEQHTPAAALPLLQRAASIDPRRFSLFPTDKFEPERIVAADLAGVSFLCKHHVSGTRVMVKALTPENLARDVAELFKETRALEEMEHPALLRLRDCDFMDETRQRPYLVTDAFDGITLAEQVRRHGPLPPADLLRIARIVADLLVAAHERNVRHRDLGPASVLLRQEGNSWRVKVVNFGLASKPTILFGSLGAPAAWLRTTIGASARAAFPYVAPEELGLIPGAVPGLAADVYSFGRLCWFALLGTPEPDDEEKAGLPPTWRTLLGHCTARTIARRPGNFQIVVKALSQIEAAPPAAAAPPPAAAADQAAVQNLLNRGMQYKQQGNFDRALAAFSKALQLDPRLVAGWIKRGNTFMDRGDYDRAVADYSAALRLDPANAPALMNRGLAHFKKGEFDAVIADCTEAVRLDSKLAQAYSIRAAAFWERGDRHRAIADYNLALRSDPKNVLAYNGRGLAWTEEGQYDRAIADYTEAIRLEPRLVVAYVNRGNALRMKEQHDQAIADFTRALRLDPANVLASFNRGLTFLARGEFDQAIADFTRVLQLDPNHPEAAIRRDEALQRKMKGSPPAAGARPTPAGKAPATAEPRAATPAKRPAPAVPVKPAAERPAPAADRPAPKSPADQEEEERRQMRAAAYFSSGRTAYDQEQYNEAIEQFTKAIQVSPRDALIWYHRGLAHIAQDEFARALGDFTEAARLNPRNAMTHYHRGLAHRLLGKHDEAIEDYSRALKLDPRLAIAYRNRSLAYSTKGDTDKARADYERAIRLDPSLATQQE